VVLIGSFNLKITAVKWAPSSVAQLLQFVQRKERKLTESATDFVQHFSGVIFFIPISILVSWLAIFYRKKKVYFIYEWKKDKFTPLLLF
jgi:hypothetical protein